MTGGRWDPKDHNKYFVASNIGTLDGASGTTRHLLCAVNEIKGEEDLAFLKGRIEAGCDVFIDSGVFNLTNEHARKYDVSMDRALALAPGEIDGFDNLMERYISIVTQLPDCWGYIEVDQGGRDNKIKTRATLEAKGLRPIPVYHPLNDGWDYFDELASQYDRICFGNIVQADRETRKRLLATAWQRRSRYPDLWIHLLGYTPNEWLNAYPINSCDSSTWLSGVRWPGANRETAALKSMGGLPRNLAYALDAPCESERGHYKAWALAGYQATFLAHNWRGLQNEYRRMGCDPYCS